MYISEQCMKGWKTKAISVVSDKHPSSMKVYLRWKSESNFQSRDLLEKICGNHSALEIYANEAMLV
jgi:hypothetical protein